MCMKFNNIQWSNYSFYMIIAGDYDLRISIQIYQHLKNNQLMNNSKHKQWL